MADDGNGGKLTEYRFGEIQRDFKTLFKKLDKFGERIGNAEKGIAVERSRVNTLYWIIPVAIMFTGALVGFIGHFT